jgi:hypothetical protein
VLLDHFGNIESSEKSNYIRTNWRMPKESAEQLRKKYITIIEMDETKDE